jgi:hypothetical protein
MIPLIRRSPPSRGFPRRLEAPAPRIRRKTSPARGERTKSPLKSERMPKKRRNGVVERRENRRIEKYRFLV